MRRRSILAAALLHASAAQALAATTAPAAPAFLPAEQAVSNWRDEAAASLAPAAAAAVGAMPAGAVARCIRLNNYWCIKRAGWEGEIASDGEGHVAFASAREGAAVAALLLRRYYLDFHRRSALAIVSRWAPAGCGVASGVAAGGSLGTLTGIAATLRARWLARHPSAAAARGDASKAGGRPSRRSRVADRVPRLDAPPSILAGEAPAGQAMTLDALMASTPGMPPSRSMIGMAGPHPRQPPGPPLGPRVAPSRGPHARDFSGDVAGPACGGDDARIAAYAARAAAGIAPAATSPCSAPMARQRPTSRR